MVANSIFAICTFLMISAVIWVLIEEHNAPDYTEDKKKENKDKKDLEDKNE